MIEHPPPFEPPGYDEYTPDNRSIAIDDLDNPFDESMPIGEANGRVAPTRLSFWKRLAVSLFHLLIVFIGIAIGIWGVRSSSYILTMFGGIVAIVFFISSTYILLISKRASDLSLKKSATVPLLFMLLFVLAGACRFLIPDKKDARDYHQDGIHCLNEQDYECAINNFDKLIDERPAYYQGYFLRGRANRAIKNYSEAIDDYDEAIQLNPQYMMSYYYRAWLHNVTGNYTMAVQDSESALRLDPDFPYLYFERGYANYKMGSFEKAIADYQSTVELAEDGDLRTLAEKNMLELEKLMKKAE